MGQSSNIRNRLLQHANYEARLGGLAKLKNKKAKTYEIQYNRYNFIKDNFNSIQYLFIEEIDNARRNQLEQYYINKYKPIYNYAGVYSPYVPVN